MMGGSAAIRPSATPRAIGGGIEDRRPWSDQSGSDLARDAGINDIGSSGQRADDNDSGSRAGTVRSGVERRRRYDDMDHDSDGFDDDGGRRQRLRLTESSDLKMSNGRPIERPF